MRPEWKMIVAASTLVLAWPGGAAGDHPPVGEPAQTKVRGAHETAKKPDKTVTDELGLTVPGVPIDHPGRVYPASEEFPTGPPIGDRLPDIVLSNQHGETIDVHADREGRRAIVVFFRSAVW